MSFNAPTDPDWVGMKVWASTVTGFVPDDTLNLLGKVNVNIASFNAFADGTPILPGTNYFVRVAAYDVFSEDPGSLNVSAEIEVMTGSIDVSATCRTSRSILCRFSRSSLALQTCCSGRPQARHVVQPVSGTVDDKSIAAGSVPWGGRTIYISYQEGATLLTASTDVQVHTRSDRTLMAIWEFPGRRIDPTTGNIIGTVTALNGKAGIAGDLIYAHTLTGQALVSDSRDHRISRLRSPAATINNAQIIRSGCR